ncbi:hypothetical protein D3C83_184820 [compost metagenome]
MAGGAFDDPSAVPPTVQFNLGHKVAFFDALPAVPRQPNEAAEAEANAAVVSRQHPDHDTTGWTPAASEPQ